MAKFACLPYFLVVKKKKSKGFSKAADGNEKRSSKGDLRVKPIDLFSPSPENHLTVLKSLPSVQKESSITPMVLSDDSFARAKPTGETAYEGGDYSDEIRSMKRDYSDLESPVLKRSCSNIETKQAKQWINSSKRSSSYSNNLQNLSGNGRVEITRETHSSPLFIRSSSSQVLPSRSKKIWRKLFLRSHRNLHKLRAPQRLVSVLSAPNLKGGYSSDGHEPCQKLDDKWKKAIESENQWVAFSLGSSPVDRVNAWVNSLDDCSLFSVGGEEYCGGMEDEQTTDLHDLVIVESSEKTCSQTNRRVAEEVAQANNIIQSLNTSSTVAHIPGIGLKVIPSISVFVCLRSVNLSGNCIVSITPGSLPKSLHTLDLSRNKISTIEGLRDLERLRVLNLSYNRIAKISHGLSSCTLIKELYLADNKISNVEGLHRLLKLTVLDLSFNKIITAKGLGQLVANYNSLLALNLLGNPILANIGDDQVRKAVLSLLPHVTYLNKQSIKPDKVREVVSESVTKAALGDVAGSSKRKLTKRLSHVSGSLPKSKVVETIKHGKSRHSTSGKLAQ